ncbi:type II toxin-antitoxin system RelE/ParE family toxin [Aquisalimonas sp. 2447]|uniref:type II toxin-antitoxin system RelE/ParE family toxin n=1 Tax=Aquisalimonas sp. 2447 TaxID=2740807 RepID=UPI0014327C22|nr:type II toxin-antitoxin system RelE/ParE family toxin [Aquisalimonas sp. 2447]QIT56594.1 type II toxin-antitoxin system RelE/ParE family toxin [Aquisalimonas sp. 2447]
MSRVIFTPAAVQDLDRLKGFLQAKGPAAAEKAAQAIIQGMQAIEEMPHIGRPIEDLPPEYRDWLVDFGDSGYIARYRLDGETAVVLAIRHQKEVGL